MKRPRSPAQLANDARLAARRKAPAAMAMESARTGRPHRAEVRKAERRRRRNDSIDRMAGFTLDIFQPEQLDLKNYVYRWVEDSGARIRVATKSDDYDPVVASEIKDFDPDTIGCEGGESIRQVTGRRENGQPIYAYLLKKPREFFDEDQRAGARRRQDQLEGRILRGETGGMGDDDPALEHAYVASGARIGNVGRQVAADEARTGRVEA